MKVVNRHRQKSGMWKGRRRSVEERFGERREVSSGKF